MSRYDAIVIGSGFGGAVSACRLAEKGLEVLVLERGRRWSPETYPRKPGDDWLWDNNRPHKRNGWVDYRFSLGVCTVQGAGVGGGSLIYANVSIDPKPDVFDHGWPKELTWEEIRPYLGKVGEMLRPTPVPLPQASPRFHMMKEGAEKLGFGDRFRPVPLAVSFDESWSYDLDDPFDERHSKPFVNPQGVTQGTCIHCGNCCAGCRVNAKNTLDTNYLAVAEAKGAEIRPLHVVRTIEPSDGGYRVVFDRIENGRLVPGEEMAERVIVAAGSMGSTELLLRCRDQYRTLPRLSANLGYRWCSNGDFLTVSFHDREVYPNRGVTIDSAIDFLDAEAHDEQVFVEDGGIPDVVREHAMSFRPSTIRNLGLYSLASALTRLVVAQGKPVGMMVWFGQAADVANGRLHLYRRLLQPWKKSLGVSFDHKLGRGPVEEMIGLHKRLAEATEGRILVPPSWTRFRKLTTPHPLGGCGMGSRIQDGVVDHKGEVFGYPRLHVLDGAIVPKALGLNPSKTIAALAERAADLMV